MPGNFKKKDLRTVKTRKALFAALPILLKRRKFSKITVFDICKEAMVSRTAFYAHYYDKYDLINHWLEEPMERFFLYVRLHTPDQTNNRLFEILQGNSAIFANLLEDADCEQRALLMTAVSRASVHLREETAREQTVINDFMAGGLFNVMLNWVKKSRQMTEEQTKSLIATIHEILLANSHWESGKI
jgi:AcrR family transcriptional regulator